MSTDLKNLNADVTKAVVGTARKNSGSRLTPVMLSTGHTVVIRPVSMSVIMDAESSIPEPEVPIFINEAKGIEEPNPDHPDYLKATERANIARQLAIADAMIMYGVDIVDEDGNKIHAPEDNEWLDTMKFAFKRGLSKIDLSEYDLGSNFERDFLFKKMFVVGVPDIPLLIEKSGALSEADVQAAVAGFQDKEA